MSKHARIRRLRAEAERAPEPERGEISQPQARARAHVRRVAAFPGTSAWTTRIRREIKRTLKVRHR